MNYRFTDAAKLSLADAVQFYNSQRAGLGLEFAVDVGLALGRVLESPKTWPELDPGFRRYRLNRFPYALIYRTITPSLVEVVLVFDLRRRPGSWRDDLTP